MNSTRFLVTGVYMGGRYMSYSKYVEYLVDLLISSTDCNVVRDCILMIDILSTVS